MTEAETQPPTTPTTTKTNIVTIADDDFVEAAGLQRSEHSAKKSSVEKLLGKKLHIQFLYRLVYSFISL